jgi:hypothetical protein
MKILVACEESQAVTKAFRHRGHDAFSCDILPSSGGHPEWHFMGDVLSLIKTGKGKLETGKMKSVKKWDMMIGHPPCTYFAASGARWYYHPEDSHLPVEARRPHPRFPNRKKERAESYRFFMSLASAPIDKIAIENPVGYINSMWRKPDQIFQPYEFGVSASKRTCLWLKNLPKLKPTKLVSPGERIYFKSGKSQPKWYSDALVLSKSSGERRTIRSKTFKEIAEVIAEQWSK